MITLLNETIRRQFGESEPIFLTLTSDNRLESWLESVWTYISKHFADAISRFSHLRLIPCLTSGSWNDASEPSKKVTLYNMNHTFLVKSTRDVENVPDKICEALERLSVKILPSLPKWLDAGRFPCIFTASGPSMVRMFEQLYKYPHTSNIFNSCCTTVDAEGLIGLLDKISTFAASDAIKLLQQLTIFKQKGSISDTNVTLVSIAACNRILSHDVQIPARLWRSTLISDSQACMSVAKKLGATEVSEDQIVSEVLQAMITANSYSDDEVHTFMLWVLDNIYKFQAKKNMMDLIRNVCFVENGNGKQKLTELYDPRDSQLKTLFADERKFPINEFATDARLNALVLLGLRTKTDVTADCLYMTAKHLDMLCRNGQSRTSLEPKATMLLRTLEERTDLLRSTENITGSQLHLSMRPFLCIPHKKDKPHGYPAELGWKGSEYNLCSISDLKSIEFSEVAGSVIPVVKFNSDSLGQMFNWKAHLEAKVLTEQLENLVLKYNSTNKAGILPLVTSVYRAMMERTCDMTSCSEFQTLLKGCCIWWGDGFCKPAQMVLERRSEDIDVKPYMYTLPCELESMRSFFIAVNCHQKQDVPVLLEVLHLIREKHNTHGKMNEHEVGKDMNLVLQILNRLFQEKIKPEQYGERLLFPIHTGDDTILVLEPATRCTYCDAQWLKDLTDEDDDDDEEILYVHADVPSRIAEGLGVKSLKTQLMSDAVGLEEWGQTERLTTRIHNIVKEGYQDGLAVPKEIIQNADDARATSVIFVYDERENEDARTQLLDEGMASCQGPALWAYNDGLFSEEDLKNITKLNEATKESDTTKIGKFGLGFCAVYNLTDVPSFVSGQNMVIFDPHKNYLNKALPGESPGLKINLQSMKNKKLMKKMHNQFKPFQNVLGCDLFQKDPYFNGTLFRLPLRTKQQAAVSEIKDSSYSREEMMKLLRQYVEACGNMLLFTQNVRELKLYHIPPSGISPDSAHLISTVTREIATQTNNKTILDICSELKVKKTLHLHPFQTVQIVQIRVENTEHMRLISNAGTGKYETDWLVSWATGESKSLQLSCSTNIAGALPLGSVAVLVKREHDHIAPESVGKCTFGFYTAGHLFCFLPLPIKSNVDFHVNGSFAVTSNRRGLQTNTEDDKYSYDTQWNEALLSDTITKALINLLVSLTQLKPPEDYKFYQMWPNNVASLTEPLRRGFYDNVILSDKPVFESYGRWIGISQCIFLNRKMSEDPEIAAAALSTLQRFNPDSKKGVVSLPVIYMNELEKAVSWREKANVVSEEDFFTNYFLPHVGETYWHESENNVSCRNRLLLYCLAHSSSTMDVLLSNVECIPTNTDYRLRKPSDLVHPEGRAAKLFEVDDGRFPEKTFTSFDILRKLLDLGMIEDTLTSEMVIDRAMTVEKLESHGRSNQALHRCQNLIAYLASTENVDKNTVKMLLGDIAFLPVLQKPNDWPFAWHADVLLRTQNDNQSNRFEKAYNLFFENCKNLVGCTKLIIDYAKLQYSQNTEADELLVQIGVNGTKNVQLQSAVEQLLSVCKTKDQQKNYAQKRVEENVVDTLYAHMDKCAANDIRAFKEAVKPLENRNIILFESELLPVSKVALSVGFNCIPELYEIGRNKVSEYKSFLDGVGVKENVEVEDVIRILQRKRHELAAVKLPPKEFQLIYQLLELLSSLMHRGNLKYQDICHLGQENIVAPDTDSVLRPTNTLCLDDIRFKGASKSMRFVHSAISRSVAESIGISTKKRKYLQDCSIGMPFEQKEELVTRLKGLLDGYPCDVGIMKELLQNADDANATEIHFIKDFRTHDCNEIFDNFVDFQGPALLVFNDSAFSQADLEGLQRLGVGSKNADPAKTGQYGVGFNAVYNLTDLPSFITKGPEIEGGETLCILDPLQKHNEEYCGMRYNMEEVRNAFPDVLAGYSEHVFEGRDRGSMFRFPLRRIQTELGRAMTTDTINEILDTLKSEMADFLLFLRSVSKITVSDISSGSLRTEYSVHVELSEDDLAKRSYFSRCCREKAKEIRETKSVAALSPPVQVAYKLLAKDSSKKEETIVIVQRLGFDENRVTQKVKDAVKMGQLGMLPIGGVAVPISQDKTKQCMVGDIMQCIWNLGSTTEIQRNKKIFCFLPLPMVSGLPMHINGHFVLDHEARRSLWVEEEGYKSEWNCLILEDVVTRCYIEALQRVKAITFDRSCDESVTEDRFNDLVKSFSKYFPISKQAKSNYETILIRSIFDTIITDREEVFPIGFPNERHELQDGQEEHKLYHISWSSYRPEGHQFPIYSASHRNSESYPLDDLLKTLGLKITLLRQDVLESMRDSGLSVSCVTPSVVVQFLQSFSSQHLDRLQIGPLPCAIAETKFVATRNIKQIMSFCSNDPSFKNMLNGLPLLVTNDGVLQCFDRNQAIYCTIFCELWPHSSNRFVHHDLFLQLCLLDIDDSSGVKRKVQIQELEDLLDAEIDKEIYTAEDMVDFKNLPDKLGREWIRGLWNLIIDGYKDANKRDHQVQLQAYLRPLQHWCLVPVVRGDETTVLVKINKLDTIVNYELFKSSQVLEFVLKKLRLPRLNPTCLAVSASNRLSTCVASPDNPVALLVCLRYYQYAFEMARLNSHDCSVVLRYFSDNLAAMQRDNRAEEWWIRETLKKLPVFLTQSGTLVSVANDEARVLVLPEDMPSDGIREWADQTNKILLQGSEFLEQIYSFLDFTFTNDIDIYMNYLLPTWTYLPVSAMKVHLEYIRDVLLTKGIGQDYSRKQYELIQGLRSTAVIPRNTELHQASEYFSPTNEVFKVFHNSDEFPPTDFLGQRWTEFLKMIGIKTEVTGSMFIEYALEVCQDTGRNITGLLKRKSLALLDCLFKNILKWNRDTCDRISQIKFIIPHKTQDRFTDIHEQYTQNQVLICFAGSISYRHEDLTWTSLPLLPREADPCFYKHYDRSGEMNQKLHIHQKPTLDSVVLHCQNVCDSLKDCLPSKAVTDGIFIWLPDFMNDLYQYLRRNGLSSDINRRLHHTPVVFLPDRKTLIPAYQTVVTILPDQEIWPYLVKIPNKYGQFSDLFTYLGASVTPKYMLYVNVLALIKTEIGEAEMDQSYMAKWLAITSAVNNLFKNINPSTRGDILSDETVLYLPTRGRQLLASSSVTVSDNRDKERRMQGAENLQYFTGFKELGLLHTLDKIKNLPENIRPKFLTQIVREEVDVSAVFEVTECEEAVKLERFLQSTSFIEGVLRLLKHAKTKRSEVLTETVEARVSSELQNVNVRCVTGLRTYLYVKNERIDASVQERKCFFHQQEGQWWIYFMKSPGDEREWIRSIDDFLVSFIIRVARSLSDHSIGILKILHMINSTADISLLLDRMNIDAYDLPQDILFSVFPPPGTYVPVELHHLLNCDLTRIGVHEYRCVAFELEDELINDTINDTDVSDAYNPVYIYVRITKKVTPDDTPVLSEMYEIDTGNELITVPLFKLYRFVHTSSDVTSRELVSTDGADQSVSTEAVNKEKYSIRFYLIEAWKLEDKADRKRVIARLLRKYHPDKNLGNEAMCNELFAYLRQCIARLERQNSLDETDGRAAQNRAYPDFTSSQYYSFVEQISNRTQRQRAYVQEYYRNDQRSYGYTGSRIDITHCRARYTPFHDLNEAKRWFRQAKVDLRNALDTIDTPGDPAAFNWVCYMCHQVNMNLTDNNQEMHNCVTLILSTETGNCLSQIDLHASTT